jgi:hypoxanthine phosphoribosyltransferase
MGDICEPLGQRIKRGSPSGFVPAGSEPKLMVLTWDELLGDVLQLARALGETRFDVLVAVARGGLVVARLLSDILSVKRVASVTIEYYEGVGERAKAPRLVEGLNFDVRGLRALVVDDVADTGETLKLAVDHVRKAGAGSVASCTVYVKPWCKFRPDYYARVVDKWVVFPYEHAETALYLLSRGWSFQQLAEQGLNRSVLEHLRAKAQRASPCGDRQPREGGL